MSRLEEIRARVEKAMDMVHALCQPRGSKDSREWIMSIPARPDHDPDIVIGSSLRDIPALLTELTALQEENARLKGALLKRQRFLHNAQVHQWREFEKCDNSECIEARKLAALSPSRTQEQK